MGKGISTTIATLLVLIVTISLIGVGYTFIFGIFSAKTAVVLSFVDFNNGELIVRNDGTSSVSVNQIKVYVSGSPERLAKIKSDKDPIPPGQIATITILDAYNYNGKKKIRVVTPGSSFSAFVNFGNNFPEGDSTWYAKIGKHTGYGINDCGWNCDDWINTNPDNSWRWTPNLVVWYRFDEGSGTIAIDETRINNGTIYGAIFLDGKFGKALSFDGVNDYVISSIGISPPSTFTANVWIYYTGDNGVVVDWLGQAGINTGYHDSGIEIVGGTVRVRYWNLPCVNLGSITPNNWYMITLVYDGSNLKGYINGEFKGSTSGALSHPSSLYIALGAADSTNCGDGTYFGGIIDEFRFYTRALSEEEIRLLYEQGVGNFTSPVSFDASSCPVKVYSGYSVCCMCEDPAKNCAGCEITGWFKKYITVPAGVNKVWMEYSTDDPIKVYVNGQLASEHNCCCNPCPTVDLTPYIQKGAENLITVKFFEACWCGYFGGKIWYE